MVTDKNDNLSSPPPPGLQKTLGETSALGAVSGVLSRSWPARFQTELVKRHSCVAFRFSPLLLLCFQHIPNNPRFPKVDLGLWPWHAQSQGLGSEKINPKEGTL